MRKSVLFKLHFPPRLYTLPQSRGGPDEAMGSLRLPLMVIEIHIDIITWRLLVGSKARLMTGLPFLLPSDRRSSCPAVIEQHFLPVRLSFSNSLVRTFPPLIHETSTPRITWLAFTYVRVHHGNISFQIVYTLQHGCQHSAPIRSKVPFASHIIQYLSTLES